MPKGADLHTHLSGAASTENLIRWGQKDGMCVRTSDATVVVPPCLPDTVPLSAAFPGSPLYQSLVSSWSLTDRTAPVRERHQRFFDAFGKFSVVANSHVTDMVDEVVRRAAAQGVVHIEIIVGFQGSAIGRVADQQMDKAAEWSEGYLAQARRHPAVAGVPPSHPAQPRRDQQDWQRPADPLAL